jgi:uroporphyrinogen-III synthase
MKAIASGWIAVACLFALKMLYSSQRVARILITRAERQSSALADLLRARGHEPILIPAIELVPPTTFAALDGAIQSLLGERTTSTFHWIVFTSANAVEAFADRVRQQSLTLQLHPTRIASIGPATTRAIVQLLGRAPTLTAQQAVAESLATALLPYTLQPDGTPTRFLLIRADQARDVLPEALLVAGAEVTIAPAYRTVVPKESIAKIASLFRSPATCPDAITFTSSSTATNLLALLQAAFLTLPPSIPRISIGPITSQTLRELGFAPNAEADEATLPSLVEALIKALSPSR